MHILAITLSALALSSLSSAIPVAHASNLAYPSGYASPTLFIPPPKSYFEHQPPPAQPTVVKYTPYKGNITIEKGIVDAKKACIVWHASGYTACRPIGRKPGETCECEYGRPMSKYDLERAQKPPKNLFLTIAEGIMLEHKVKNEIKKAKEIGGGDSGSGKKGAEKEKGMGKKRDEKGDKKKEQKRSE